MSSGRLEHPGRWLWLLLLVPVVLGFNRLSLDVDVFNLLPEDLPAVQGLQIHQKHFANARELILTIAASSPAAAEDGARTVAAVLRSHTNLVSIVTWQPPWIEHPEWAAELIGYLWLNQPPERFQVLSDKLTATNLVPLLDSARDTLASSMSPEEIGRLSYDPFGLTQLPNSGNASLSLAPTSAGFASEDGKVRLVFVQAASELKTYQDCQSWLARVKGIVNESLGSTDAQPKQKQAEVDVGYTGRPAFVAEIAGGMQMDMTVSAGGTAVIIAALFYLWHRRFRPMLWLLVLLGAILAGTLGLGGLFYGSLNVVSLGFAAILLGLAVDYAVVHYQEAISNPDLTVPEIRRAIAPSITWAAVTTIAAFLTLNLGGLPGLGQLGTMVAAGVTLSAGVMVFEFLPPLFPLRASRTRPGNRVLNRDSALAIVQRSSPSTLALAASGLLLASVIAVLVLKGPPGIDPSAEPLRPVRSPAYDAMGLVRRAIGQEQEPFWLLISGTNEQQVATRLAEAEALSEEAQSRGLLKSYTIPTALWPNPGFQHQNRELSSSLVSQRLGFRKAAEEAGFAPGSLALLERVLDTWSASTGSEVFWPTNPLSRWILEKLTARAHTNLYALALLMPKETGLPTRGQHPSSRLQSDFNREGMWLTGWELLGDSIYGRVRSHFPRVFLPMVALVLVSLCIAYKRITEVTLSVLALSLSALCLLAIMQLAGWSWNLLNLMAVPLVLGTGVDYGIFMLLGLRRYHGSLALTNRAVTRALLLCGATAITGFGSLAFSSNAGMASLGKVCATGIACNMGVALFLLPAWWLHWASPAKRAPAGPSLLYRATFWKLGLGIVRGIPYPISRFISRAMLSAYWLLATRRRQIVIENLCPATGGDVVKTRQFARRLYKNFADKLTDLLRYEAGLPVEPLLGEATDWDLYQKARDEKRGVLLITPHLGNWEFGALFLTRMGEDLHVITLIEPGRDLTELRQEARSRRNIKTIVIGQDAFAFLEIIRRLETGATVALLIDRPPPSSSVRVKLFGQDFPASIAAAELARASGCVLLPVYVPRTEGKYHAHLLPPVTYNRAELRDREARRQLTEKILQAFEPVIRSHLDQWYHFVPVWAQQRGRRDRLEIEHDENP